MECKRRIRDAASFVITEHEQNRHTRRCESLSGASAVSTSHAGTRLRYNRSPPWTTTSTSTGARGLERPLEILKEVVPASTPDHSRARGPIETDVRVGYEQDTHVTPTRVRRRVAHRPAQGQRRSAARRELQPQPGV